MRSMTFKKVYTRDNCFILQEIWGDGLSRDYFGEKNPYFPPQVNYINDGAVEIWESEKGLQWFMDRLLLKNKKDKKFLSTCIIEHTKTEKQLYKKLKGKYLKSITELKGLLELIEKGNNTFQAIYYSAVDDRSLKNLRKKALTVRKKDSFYDKADYLIRKTIEYLYPMTKGLTISILRKELSSLPNRNILKRRFNNCIMIIDGTLEITDFESFTKKNKKYKFIVDKVYKTDSLKGQIAYKGYAKGKVKIIRRKDQIASFRKGEILVSPMTTPDFLPAMKKTIAIITDEGGITSHAAIIARELKKPCIIGTKIATKVLKDGDLVEVDADKGVVKILKRL